MEPWQVEIQRQMLQLVMIIGGTMAAIPFFTLIMRAIGKLSGQTSGTAYSCAHNYRYGVSCDCYHCRNVREYL